MCISAGAALVLAATAISTYATVESGRQQKKFGEYQAKQAEADAEAAEAMGRIQAEKIRKAGQRVQDQAKLQIAGAGLSLDSVSADDVTSSITEQYESDALAAIYSGRNGAMNTRAAGRYAQSQGEAAYSSSLLSGASTAMSGWSSAYRYQPQQTAAPIDTSRNVTYINR